MVILKSGISVDITAKNIIREFVNSAFF